MPQLPPWLKQLRDVEIMHRVRNDPRSGPGLFLGVSSEDATRLAAGWGQANFDEPWGDLSADDRVLLYAYFMQLGHLEELVEAFGVLFGDTCPEERPIVVDLGCGPFTGGLAFADALGSRPLFDYIGVDRSTAMCDLGERLAVTAKHYNATLQISRHWSSDISSISWSQPLGWRPVFVIVSYLLASPTLDVVELITDLEQLLLQLSLGTVTVLYTNSQRPEANKRFPEFHKALCDIGFKELADDTGTIEIERMQVTRTRELRYALFHRPIQNSLSLGDN